MADQGRAASRTRRTSFKISSARLRLRRPSVSFARQSARVSGISRLVGENSNSASSLDAVTAAAGGEDAGFGAVAMGLGTGTAGGVRAAAQPPASGSPMNAKTVGSFIRLADDYARRERSIWMAAPKGDSHLARELVALPPTFAHEVFARLVGPPRGRTLRAWSSGGHAGGRPLAHVRGSCPGRSRSP